MKVKVIIEDGCVQCVMATKGADVEVEVVNFDSEDGKQSLLRKAYAKKGLENIEYTMNKCSENIKRKELN